MRRIPSGHKQDASAHTRMPSTRTLDIDVHRISGVVVVDILDLDVVVTVKVYLILFYCVFFPYSPKKTIHGTNILC